MCRSGIEKQMYRTDLCSQHGEERVEQNERGSEIYILLCVNQPARGKLLYNTGTTTVGSLRSYKSTFKHDCRNIIPDHFINTLLHVSLSLCLFLYSLHFCLIIICV